MRRLTPLLIGAGLLLVTAGFLLLGDGPEPSDDLASVEQSLRPDTTSRSTISTDPAPPISTSTLPPVADPHQPPEEAKPIAVPVELKIDAIGLTAPIGPYGVDERTGRMAVPDNITEVGWYRFGPKPGEPGSAVLAAHVDLAGLGPGVFFDLATLVEGDLISVAYADGSKVDFRVVARGLYHKDELPLDAVFSRQGPPVLTLITCGGDFDRSVSRYDSNVVVYAVPAAGPGPMSPERSSVGTIGRQRNSATHH
jgi:sortase (surface protein transpeptidase)